MRSISPAIYLRAVSQKLRALRDVIDEYERDVADSSSKQFFNAVRLIVDVVETFQEQSVIQCNQIFGSDPIVLGEKICFCSKISLNLLANIHQEYLPYLQKATHRTEHSVVPSIQRAAALYEENVQIALLPDFEYNYGYLGIRDFGIDHVKDLSGDIKAEVIEELRRRAAALPKWTAFLIYPISESRSALNLCVLAHELAHFVDHHQEIYKNFLPVKLHEDSARALVSTLCNTSFPGGEAQDSQEGQLTLGFILTKDFIEATTVSRCVQIFESWLKEIIADILAVHALGPSYVFSLTEFLAHVAAENAPKESHPAPAIRLNMAIEELRYLGYMDAHCPLRDVLLTASDAAREEAAATKHETFTLVAFNTLQMHLPRIRELLRTFSSSFSYKATTYAAEVPLVIETLSKGIAPVERKDSGRLLANSVVAILNAGWEVYNYRYADFEKLFHASLDQSAKLAILNSLMFKAIEAGEIVRRWAHKA